MTKVKKESKNYFTQETENAIVLYNSTSDLYLKNKIYKEKIHNAFFKLTQNIIHTFKFYHTEVENIEDLQHELIVFLLTKIHLFNPKKSINDKIGKIINDKNFTGFLDYYKDKVTINQKDIIEYLNQNDSNFEIEHKNQICLLFPPKAYSYFGTIVKRWLITYNESNYKKKINVLNIDEIPEENTPDDIKQSQEINKLSHSDKISLFIDLYVEYCTENLSLIFPKKIDSQIADAVLEIFRKRENLNEIMDGKWNKKLLYIYIKEIIDVKTPKITQISDKLKDIYVKNYIFYLENGYIKFSHH